MKNCRLGESILWTFVFACSMGLLEAICVIYLRRLILPAGIDAAHDTVPSGILPIEPLREACTIIMLLSVSWIAGFNWRSRAAFFFFMFGVWDITYYIGLKWLANWPSSWIEWDCLFLIPKIWYGPVLAPVIISCYFIFACLLLLLRESSPSKLRFTKTVFFLQLSGFSLWYWSFVKDSDYIMANGYKGADYSWTLLISGLIICFAGLWLSSRKENIAKKDIPGNQ